ncbi:uncharacterized protein K489DRAFT_94824 [Dissoconium aciculare CBS 342.82]|uniref:Uncharacterized protein n=1 Tax=Dissoconium aciculare CBS 342.82 TaxID=1314786 RepID=A0A6J3LT49_9PEZI|nr:uncharacterized protein K489DRAFT_94824 [Dissoconium aciculare CBS 342.82]KAF1818459.1 hypothetical protein K489DRAFT_94824 [Dissoconium aciculare CBS 342.82]
MTASISRPDFQLQPVTCQPYLCRKARFASATLAAYSPLMTDTAKVKRSITGGWERTSASMPTSAVESCNVTSASSLDSATTPMSPERVNERIEQTLMQCYPARQFSIAGRHRLVAKLRRCLDACTRSALIARKGDPSIESSCPLKSCRVSASFCGQLLLAIPCE